MATEDRYATVAAGYARHRPAYPDGLYAWIAAHAPGREVVWDAGTGSGQAAVALASRFERVVATDSSRPQLSHARPHPRVHYVAARSEAVPLRTGAVDAVTAAAALHWFDLEPFYAQVRRVLRPGGLLAAFSYHLGWVEPAIDAVVNRFYYDHVRAFFHPWIVRLEAHYREVPFPFEPLAPPPLEVTAEWTLPDLVGFISSWSGTAAYRKAKGRDPVALVAADLEAAWGDPQRRRTAHWPLHVRAGRV